METTNTQRQLWAIWNPFEKNWETNDENEPHVFLSSNGAEEWISYERGDDYIGDVITITEEEITKALEEA